MAMKNISVTPKNKNICMEHPTKKIIVGSINKFSINLGMIIAMQQVSMNAKCIRKKNIGKLKTVSDFSIRITQIFVIKVNI